MMLLWWLSHRCSVSARSWLLLHILWYLQVWPFQRCMFSGFCRIIAVRWFGKFPLDLVFSVWKYTYNICLFNLSATRATTQWLKQPRFCSVLVEMHLVQCAFSLKGWWCGSLIVHVCMHVLSHCRNYLVVYMHSGSS